MASKKTDNFSQILQQIRVRYFICPLFQRKTFMSAASKGFLISGFHFCNGQYVTLTREIDQMEMVYVSLRDFISGVAVISKLIG